MFRTAARIAAIAAVTFAASSPAGAMAVTPYELKDVVISSATPGGSSAMLLPAVQKVREAAAR